MASIPPSVYINDADGSIYGNKCYFNQVQIIGNTQQSGVSNPFLMTPSIAAANTFTYATVANGVINFQPTYQVIQDAVGRARINTDLNIVGNVTAGSYLNYPVYTLPSNLVVTSVNASLLTAGNLASNSATIGNLSSNLASVGQLTAGNVTAASANLSNVSVSGAANISTVSAGNLAVSGLANVVNLRYNSAVGNTLNVQSIFCSNLIGYLPNLQTITGNLSSYQFSNTSNLTANSVVSNVASFSNVLSNLASFTTAQVQTLTGNSVICSFGNAVSLVSNSANIQSLTSNTAAFSAAQVQTLTGNSIVCSFGNALSLVSNSANIQSLVSNTAAFSAAQVQTLTGNSIVCSFGNAVSLVSNSANIQSLASNNVVIANQLAANTIGINTTAPLYPLHTLPASTDTPASNPDASGSLMAYEDCSGAGLSSGTLSGNATYTAGNGYVTLTPGGQLGKNGQLNYQINPGSAFDVTFECFVGTSLANWGEGICFTCFNNQVQNASFGGAIDIYQQAQRASGYCLTLIDSNYGSGGGKSLSLFWNATLLTSVPLTTFQMPTNIWTQVRINFVRNLWKVWVGPNQLLNFQDVNRVLVGSSTYSMAFNGQNGSAPAAHLIRNIQISKHAQGPWRPLTGNASGLQYTGAVTVAGNLGVASLSANTIFCSNIVGLNTVANIVDIAGNSFSYLYGNTATLQANTANVGTLTVSNCRIVGGQANVSSLGATQANVASLGATTLFCSNIAGYQPPVANFSSISGSALSYLTANTGNLIYQTAQGGAIIASSIQCSNIQGYTPPIANFSSISGSALSYLTANTGNLIYQTAQGGAIIASSIQCSNIQGYTPPVANFSSISGFALSYLTANTGNLIYQTAQGGAIIASSIQCSNIQGYTPPVANFSSISGSALSYLTANTGNLIYQTAQGGAIIASSIQCSNIQGYTPPVANFSSISGSALSYLTANTGNLIFQAAQGSSLAINQPTPQYTLDVGGNVRAITNTIFQQSPSYTNFFLGNTLNTNQSGFVNWNAAGTNPPAPGAPASLALGLYNVGGGVTIGPTGNVGVNKTSPLAALDVGGAVRVGGNVGVSGINPLIFGYDVSGKEVNAGSIGYGTFSAGGYLDVVGAGTLAGQRKVQVFDNLTVNGGSINAISGNVNASAATFTNPITASLVLSGGTQGDMINKTFSTTTDRYGVGAYNPGITRLFSSGTIASSVNLSIATDGNVGFQDLLLATNAGVTVNRPLTANNLSVTGSVGINQVSPSSGYALDVTGNVRVVAGNVGVSGSNPLCVGYDVAGKEPNAGKIGYGTFSTGQALDIVGAGSSGSTNRTVKIYDNLLVSNSSIGTLSSTFNVSSGSNQNHFIQGPGYQNLFIGNAQTTSNSGFLTFNNPTTPGYTNSLGIGVYGAPGGITCSPNGSVGISQQQPLASLSLDVYGPMRATQSTWTQGWWNAVASYTISSSNINLTNNPSIFASLSTGGATSSIDVTGSSVWPNNGTFWIVPVTGIYNCSVDGTLNAASTVGTQWVLTKFASSSALGALILGQNTVTNNLNISSQFTTALNNGDQIYASFIAGSTGTFNTKQLSLRMTLIQRT